MERAIGASPCTSPRLRRTVLSRSRMPATTSRYVATILVNDLDCAAIILQTTQTETRRQCAQPNLNASARVPRRLWREGIDPRGTLAERYLTGRGLELGDDLAGEVLRWHPRLRAMVALFRGIRTDRPQALSRTYLDDEGRKLGRKFLGPVGGAAIKLDADENVLGGLHIGEGVETCLAARQLGLRPTWRSVPAARSRRFPSSGDRMPDDPGGARRRQRTRRRGVRRPLAHRGSRGAD